MGKFVAIRPINYAGRYYAAGDEIPYDTVMTPIWLRGTSVMVTGASEKQEPKPMIAPKQRSAAAEKLAAEHNRKELVDMAKHLGVDSKTIKLATNKEKLAEIIVSIWPKQPAEHAGEGADNSDAENEGGVLNGTAIL